MTGLLASPIGSKLTAFVGLGRSAALAIAARLWRQGGGANRDLMFEAVVDACGHAVLQCGPDGIDCWASEQFRHLLPGVGTGERMSALRAHLSADDTAAFDRAWARAVATCRTQLLDVSISSASSESLSSFKSASVDAPIQLSIVIQPLAQGERFAGVALLVRDVSTERRRIERLERAEERERLIAQNSSDLIVELDLDWSIVSVAGSCRRMLGRDPATLMTTRLADLVHPADWPALENAIADIMLGGDFGPQRFRLKGSGHPPRWLEARLDLRCATSGEPERLVVTLRSVEARRLLEDALCESAANLRETNRLLCLAEEVGEMAHWSWERGSQFDYGHALHALSGRLPGRSIHWRSLLGQVVPQHRRSLFSALRLATHRRDPVACTVHVRGVDGRSRPLRVAIGGRRSPEGESIGWFGMVGPDWPANGDPTLNNERGIETPPVVPCRREHDRAGLQGRKPMQAERSTLPLTPASAPPTPGRLAVLVAEDNPVNRRLIVQILQQQGHDVVGVSNGREAIDACHAATFDAVVLDLMMPEFDGLTAARRIRLHSAAHAQTPMIALTADASPERQRFARLAGFDAFLAKPVSPKELRTTIENLALAKPGPPTDVACDHADHQPDELSFQSLLDFERLDQLVRLLGHDHFDALTSLLRTELTDRPHAIRTAAQAGDWVALAAEAHHLKGASGSAGAPAVAALAATIEHAAAGGRSAAGALDDLGRVCVATLAALDAHIASEEQGSSDRRSPDVDGAARQPVSVHS